MHVLIVNCVSLNGGDAAILTSIVTLVRLRWGAQTEITVLDAHAEEAARHLPNLRFRQSFDLRSDRSAPLKRPWLENKTRGLPRFARLTGAAALLARGAQGPARWLCSESEYQRLQCFAQADLVISTGGTYIVPHYKMGNKLLNLALAYVTQTPYVLYTQSVGNFQGSKRFASVAACLRRAAFVLLRDERSLRNVLALGVSPAHCRVVPDVVFSMANDEFLGERAPLRHKPALRVIVSVRDWSHFSGESPDVGMSRYKHAVATALTELVRTRKANVTFLSTCQGIAAYGYDDSIVAQQVRELMPLPERNAVIVNRDRLSAEQLQGELAQADLLIATRMHMAILGLCSGTPVLPIAYEFKTKELFEHFGFSDWVQSIDQVTAESLNATVQRVLSEVDTRRAELFDAVRKAKDGAIHSIYLVPPVPGHA